MLFEPPPPRLPVARVERIAERAVQPHVTEGPVTVDSIRFVLAGGRRAWIVRLSASEFIWYCPLPPPGEPANNCVETPARVVVVHVRDATGQAYSVVPVAG
ncbi:MAG TPA: hypothetical protein VIG35_00725 [Gaiellaceae bacterium]|jgi:hypothetical protein